ncbi:MAG: hypothetical protein JW866_04675, partial [Ignavibacteriales bacterium]|nr:hypothetical protein [Ignavibacteriales bacterium]
MDDLKSSNNEKKDGLKEFLLKIIPYIHILLKNKWKIVIINFIASLFIAGYLYFLIEPYYDCSINILPEYGNKSGTFSSLASLASMAGIRVGDMAPTAIYEKLLYSESVIKNVVYKKYKTEKF